MTAVKKSSSCSSLGQFSVIILGHFVPFLPFHSRHVMRVHHIFKRELLTPKPRILFHRLRLIHPIFSDPLAGARWGRSGASSQRFEFGRRSGPGTLKFWVWCLHHSSMFSVANKSVQHRFNQPYQMILGEFPVLAVIRRCGSCCAPLTEQSNFEVPFFRYNFMF